MVSLIQQVIGGLWVVHGLTEIWQIKWITTGVRGRELAYIVKLTPKEL